MIEKADLDRVMGFDNQAERLTDYQFSMMAMLMRGIGTLVIIVLLVILAGCKSAAVVTPPPVEAQCDAVCYAPCVDPETKDTGIRWEGPALQPTTTDALEGDVIPQLAGKLRECDVNRQACVKCLDRLEQNKVIRQPPHENPSK